MSSIRFCFLLFALCGLHLFGAVAQGAPQATASLSQTTMAPGDGATLSIEVSGATKIDPPASIDAKGLDIRYNSYRQSVQIINNQMTRSISLIYTVEARNAGTFTIPSVGVQTDVGEIKTQPLTLTVQAPAPGAKRAVENDVTAFATIEVPKTTVYVGESVPVEMRFYSDRLIRARIEEMPVLEGEGFTKVKFPRPREEMARRNGRDFSVLTFRTTISPGKAGTLKLGPMEVPFLASIPRAQRNRRSPLDLFDDSFFDDPFGTFGRVERRKVTAEAIELDVKPLPAAGRPEGFSGAVGKFQMAVEGNPKRVKVGDPITLKMQISGTGNFDRVNAPTLVDPSGWHPYEASGNFQPKDELSNSGTKTFEMAVVPEEKKTQMPQVRFSYFDPVSEKYVTLNSEAAALLVEGARPAPVAPKPNIIAETASPEVPAPAPAPAPEAVKDIVGLKYEMGARRNSFAPLYRMPVFWLAQSVPLLGFLGLLGMRFLRKDEAASRTALLRKQRAELWRKLRGESEEAEFFQTAARIVQVQTALTTGQPDASVDASAARSARALDPETAAGIAEIFNARDERVFAGTARGNGRLDADTRERVVATLERFEKSHAKN